MYGDGPASKERSTAERIVPERRRLCTLFHGGGRETPNNKTTGQQVRAFGKKLILSRRNNLTRREHQCGE